MLAKIACAALAGVDAVPVTVEVSVDRGLPCFLVVGLPDTSVRESRDRVAAALRNARLEFPAARVTVNLAPADLRKEGTWFDLPIALAVLAASGQIDPRRLREWCVLGELSLDGSVRPVRGVLAVALAAEDAGWRGLLVPAASAGEARAPATTPVVGVSSLGEAIAWARGADIEEPAPPPALGVPEPEADPLRSIHGQEAAKRALEIAATGGHALLLVGPPGTGKTLLARALPALLPPLARAEALEVSRIHSVAGTLPAGCALLERPPFRAPHVSATAAGLLGGGAPFRPGELSLAHRGVLFLDELPEFSRTVLEALRQPIESGEIMLARAWGRLRLPARFQWVAAMNPCRCGLLGHPRRACRCSPSDVVRYRGRISGPILDRIDLVVDVPLETEKLPSLWAEPDGGSSENARARVVDARTFAAGLGRLNPNAQLESDGFRAHVPLASPAERLLRDATERFSLSVRAVHRMLRVTRTIADLAGRERCEEEDVAEALGFRHHV